MRAAILYDVNDIRIEERPVPALSAGEVLVRTAASGICTSDVMAWYVKRKAPLVLGHEPAGVIAALGPGDAPADESGRPFAVGDRVFAHHHAPCFGCRPCSRGDYVQCPTWRNTRIEPGGISEYFRVPSENLRDTLRLPSGVPFADGSLVEPLGCVVKSLRRGGAKSGDTVFVVGLGVMGLMHVAAARALGATVVASDFVERRRDLAASLGANAVHPSEAKDALGDGADVAICGPGIPGAMDASVAGTGRGGTIVMFSPFEPGNALTLDAERVYFEDLSVVASYSCGPQDTREALRLIASGAVTADALGATTVTLDDAPDAYRDLAQGRIVKPIVLFD